MPESIGREMWVFPPGFWDSQYFTSAPGFPVCWATRELERTFLLVPCPSLCPAASGVSNPRSFSGSVLQASSAPRKGNLNHLWKRHLSVACKAAGSHNHRSTAPTKGHGGNQSKVYASLGQRRGRKMHIMRQQPLQTQNEAPSDETS